MSTTIHAVYDGATFRPEEPVDLEPNTGVRVTIEPEKKPPVPSNRAFRKILIRATDLGVSDLATQHDHYLYGTEADHVCTD